MSQLVIPCHGCVGMRAKQVGDLKFPQNLLCTQLPRVESPPASTHKSGSRML